MATGQGAGRFPLLRLLTGQAPVLIEHAEAYADLAAEELAAAAAGARRRVLGYVISVLAASMTLGFGGIALMLWGALPPEPAGAARWLLWAVPGGCALITIVSFGIARSTPTMPAFAQLRSQWRQDLALLREGIAP